MRVNVALRGVARRCGLDAHHEQYKIRVAGIDAPEKSQPFGQRSKESLAALLVGKEVDGHWHKQDRYQRIVGKMMVAAPTCRASQCPKTLDAGLAHLTVGLAWWYAKYAKEQSPEDAGRYKFAEHEAGAKSAGMGRRSSGVAVGVAEGGALMEPKSWPAALCAQLHTENPAP